MIRKGAIKLNDIQPGKTYMVRDGKEYLPVTVVCSFTRGWLRGWVRMINDPLWSNQDSWVQKVICVKPFDARHEISVSVERIGDEYYCQSYMGLTLFQYDKGWFDRKRGQLRDKIHALQCELESLTGLDPENEKRIQRMQLMKQEGLMPT
jgi:hypothetical protein